MSRKSTMGMLAALLSLCMMFTLFCGAAAFAAGADTADEGTTAKFHRMTNLTELQAKAHYIIVNHEESFEGGTVHALSTAADTYCSDVAMSKEAYDSGKNWEVSLDSDSVLTLSFSTSGANNLTANDGQKLKIGADSTEEGLKVMFSNSAGGITFTENEGLWALSNSSRYLQYADGVFAVTKKNWNYFEVWTDAAAPTQPEEPEEPEEPDDPDEKEYGNVYYRVTDLSQLESLPGFVMVVTDPADGVDKMLGYTSSGILVEIGDAFDSRSDSITAPEGDVVFSVGSLQEQSNTNSWYKYTYLQLQITGGTRYWYPKAGDSSISSALRGSGSNVRFEYGAVGADGYKAIYLRGNGDSFWLGVDGDTLAMVEKANDQKVAVRIYAPIPVDETRIIVTRYDETGKPAFSGTVNPKQYELPRLGDVEVENGVKVDAKTDTSVPYAFLGWTWDSALKDKLYLTKDESCNLFDSWTQDDGTEKSAYTETALEAYHLLGSGNPDVVDMADLTPYIKEGDTELNLYPIYAVRGFDTTVFAKEESMAVVTEDDYSNAIVGISDWKELEPNGSSYKDMTKEKWLGSIFVEIYKDGKQWGDTETLYFSYHNDNAADLNLKFIHNDLVGKYTKESFLDSHPDYPEAYKPYLSDNDLYWYLTEKDDENAFPKYDQIGHFVIDAVIADQGGSQDGLKYEFNWMTEYGGQLDNVVGGSTVKVYVTTKYNVEYYLDYGDGDGFTQIKEGDWLNPATYTTCGTEEAFTKAKGDYDTTHTQYFVTAGNENEALMDRDAVKGNFKGEGVSDLRGGYANFAYYINGPRNRIPIAESPEELLSDALKLKNGYWSLRDANGKERARIDWSSKYDIDGSYYGTGNTSFSFKNLDALTGFEAMTPYTFHLYAVPSGSLTVSKTVSGDEADKEKAFTFTITIKDAKGEGLDSVYKGKYLDDEEIDVAFVNGVATIKLRHGESLTIRQLPVGATYTVVESDNDGYTVKATGDTGTISIDGNTAAISNIKNAPPEKPEDPPETGDSGLSVFCIVALIASLSGVVLFGRKRKERA